MKKLKERLKSNRGFTMQDLIIGMIVVTLFAGIVGSSFLAIYHIQAETQMTSLTSLYGIQILENIDKISYEEVVDEMEEHYREIYQISEKINLNIEVNQYDTEDTIKTIKLTMSYQLFGKTENLLLEKIKVREK